MRKKRFLCVCQKGCNRSVFMAYRLKRHGHEAVPCGWLTESTETLEMLCLWADAIFVMQAEFRDKIAPKFHDKVYVVDVGRDVWGPRWHPELKKLVYGGYDKLKAEGVL